MTDPELPDRPVSPPDGVTAAIRRNVAANLAPVRTFSVAQRWSAGALLVGVTLACVGMGAAWLGWVATAPVAFQWSVAAAGGLLSAFVFARVLGRHSLRGALRAALVAAPPLAYVGVVWLSGATCQGAPPEGPFSTSSCMLVGSLIAALPFVGLFGLWRRTDPFSPGLTGALIGSWSGLVGASGLSLLCPSLELSHLLPGHGGAIVGGALLGVWAGRRLLAP